MAKRATEPATDPNQGVMMGGFEREASPADTAEPELDENWEDILLQSNDEAGAASPDDGTPGTEADSKEKEPPAADDPQKKLELENAQLKAVLATLQQAKQAPAATEEEPSLDDRVKEVFTKHGYEDVPRETLGLFKDLVNDLMPSYVEPLKKELGAVSQAVQATRGETALSAFEAGLDKVMTDAGLSAAEKPLFKSAVSLQGLQKYGNQFDLPRAAQLFGQLHGDWKKEQVEKTQSYAQGKRTAAANAPPRTERGRNGTTVEDIQKHFEKSTKKEDDFGGSNWRKYIRGRTHKGTS